MLSFAEDARRLRAKLSASATFGGFFFFDIIGATGTGRAATSTAFGATCSGFFPTSGAMGGITAGEAYGGSRDQTGNAEPGQYLFKIS